MKNATRAVKVLGAVAIALAVAAASLFTVFMAVRSKQVIPIRKLTDIEWYSEEEREFTITTAQELYDLASLSEHYTFEGQTFKLGADIVVNEGHAENWGTLAPVNKWYPIVNFAGTFDGQGHTISGLYANYADYGMGLFHKTAPSCVIENFRLVNSYFKSSGDIGCGSIVGEGAGTLRRIYSNATVIGLNRFKSGMIGQTTGNLTMEECWFDGSFTNITNTVRTQWGWRAAQNSGGFIGYVSSGNVVLENCLNTGLNYTKAFVTNKSNDELKYGQFNQADGPRFGGFIGCVSGGNATNVTLDRCFFAGTLSSDGASSQVSTLVGRQTVDSGISTPLTITNCYATKESVTIEKLQNYIVDRLYQATGPITADNVKMYAEQYFRGTQAFQRMNLDFTNQWILRQDALPTLRYFSPEEKGLDVQGLERGADLIKDISWYEEAEGTAEDPYILKDAADLYGFAKLVNAGNTFFDKVVKLGADIKVNSGNAADWAENMPLAEWISVMNFAGTFDGQGHTISGLYYKHDINQTARIGLFGTTAKTAVLKNFSLINSYFSYVRERDVVGMGSILAMGNGRLENIYSNAIIETTKLRTGGLVGSTLTEDSLVISNCWFDGAVRINSTGNAYAGGIMGMVGTGNLRIEHCLNSGSIYSGAGEEKGPRIGGIIGSVDGGSGASAVISDCLNVGKITTGGATSQVASLVGRQTIYKGENTPFTLTDCFAARETVSAKLLEAGDQALYQASGKANVSNVKIYAVADISGVGAYQRTSLDFDNYWAIRKDNTPVLKRFANAGETVSTKNLHVERAAELFWDTAWYTKAKGTAEDPYILTDVGDLYGLAQLVNGGNDFAGKTVKLGADIAVNNGNASDWAKTAPISTWSPLKKFAGTFDGQGHTISGLYYKKTDATRLEYIGLFGETTKEAVIKNVSLKNTYFCYDESADKVRVGSIAGIGRGRFENIYSNAIVTSGKFGTGGLIGATDNALVISNCWFDGAVQANAEDLAYAGGIIGLLASGSDVAVEHVLNSGSVHTKAGEGQSPRVGGIVGSVQDNAKLAMDDCVNTGRVTSNGAYAQVATLVGRKVKNASLTLTNSYASMESCGIEKLLSYPVDRLYQATGAVTVSNVEMLDSKQLQGIRALQATKLNFRTYWSPITDKTPILTAFVADKTQIADTSDLILPDSAWLGAAAGTAEDPYVLKTAADLYGLAEQVNDGNDFAGKYIVLANDITVNKSDRSTWGENPPINTWLAGSSTNLFAGHLDGQSHTISGLYHSAAFAKGNTAYLGLFSHAGDGCEIKNLSLKNCAFTNSTLNADNCRMGSFVGQTVSGSTTRFENLYSDAVLTNYGFVMGGIVGANYGTTTISNCWFAGSASSQTTLTNGSITGGILGWAVGDAAMEHCHNSGTVYVALTTGNAHSGGLVGKIDSRGTNMSAADSVATPTVTIDDCLNTGAVSSAGAISRIATLVGSLDSTAVTITNTYATTESCGVALSGNNRLYQKSASFGPVTENVAMVDAANLYGAAAYANTLLDIDTYWTPVEGKTPILTAFVTDETAVDVSNMERAIGTSKSWLSRTAGTQNDPYVLKTAADLYGLSALVQEGNSFTGKHIVLANDITVNTTDRDTWTDGAQNLWTPVGTAATPFAGHFDGRGYTISGIYQTTPANVYYGLFGTVSEICIIENLRLENSAFAHAKTGDTGRMGSIVGLAKGGTFRNLYSDAKMTNGAIVTGGILGVALGKVSVSGCWFDGAIHATDNRNYLRAAGIVGWVAGEGAVIEHCLNTGSIRVGADVNRQAQVGGLVGFIETGAVVIEDSLSTGRIQTAGARSSVSTIVGLHKSDTAVTVTNTYAVIECVEGEWIQTSPENYLLQVWPGKTANLNDVEMRGLGTDGYASIVGAAAYTNTLLDFDTYWTPIAGKSPILTVFVTDETTVDVSNMERVIGTSKSWLSRAAGTQNDPYVLKTAADLYGLADEVNSGNSFADKHIVLANDITVNAGSRDTWDTTPPLNEWRVGASTRPFAGHLDGQGHTISGLYCKKTTKDATYLGLFSHTSAGCVIENLRLTNSVFTYAGTGDYGRMGSFVAWADGGTFRNLYSDAILTNNNIVTGGIVGLTNGAVDISDCNFAGEIHAQGTAGTARAGGILGWAAGGPTTIQHCLNSGSITREGTGTLNRIGGILGWSGATVEIRDCLNTGIVDGNGVINQITAIVGGTPAGALTLDCVYATQESLANYSSFNASQISGNQHLYQRSGTGSVTPTNVAMVTQASLTGESAKTNTALDFENYWTVAEGETPVLKNAGKVQANEPLAGVEYVDVIIFGGQSNMQGQSDALISTDPVSGAFEYKYLADSFTSLQNPVGEDIKYDKTRGTAITTSTNLSNWLGIHVLGSAAYGHTNLVPKFCENYISQTGSHVVAVHAAKGSTKIEDWLPGTPGYEMLAEKACAAIAAAKTQTVVRDVYFVWLQGESNALAKTAKDDYKEMIVTLCNALKADVGIDKFGVIRVGRFAGDERDDVIIAAQSEICLENSDFLMLTTIAAELNAQPEYMNPNVAGHYSATGLEKIGTEAGSTLGKYAKSIER